MILKTLKITRKLKNENISGFLRNPDLLSSIEKAFNGENSNDLEIELRNPSVLRMNVTIYQDIYGRIK